MSVQPTNTEDEFMIDFLANAYSEQIEYENINSEYAEMFESVNVDDITNTRDAFILQN